MISDNFTDDMMISVKLTAIMTGVSIAVLRMIFIKFII